MNRHYISSEKRDRLASRMKHAGIREKDIQEKFVLGSGKGGQKVNKTSSCVLLHHLPTGIRIRRSRDRSRSVNRYLARKELCDRIEAAARGEKSAKLREMAKIRRQKSRRSRRRKARILEEKKKQSEKKKLRRPAGSGDVSG